MLRLPGHLGDERDRLTPQARRRDLSLYGIAITPDGTTAYVVGCSANGSWVWPVTLATGAVGAAITMPISVGGSTYIVINPAGTYAYVVQAVGAIQVISLATNTIVAAISVTNCYYAAITPDGKTMYVSQYTSQTVVPVTLATNAVGSPISVGANCYGIAITPNGNTAWVSTYGSHTIVPITTATNTAGTPVTLPSCYPYGLAITPDSTTAYVLNYYNSSTGLGSVVPVNLATGALGKAITVDAYCVAIAICSLPYPPPAPSNPGQFFFPLLAIAKGPRSTPAIL